VTLGLLLLVTGHAEGRDLYVDRNAPRCSDATPYAQNDSANPWCSLGRAAWGSTQRTSPDASQAAAAGDTVIVRPGTYATAQGSGGSSSTVTYQPVNSGTKAHPIVFSCAVIRGCILTFTGGSFGIVLGTVGKDYITWRGFVHDNSAADWRPHWHATIRGSVGSVIEHSTFIGDASRPLPDNNAAIFIQESSDVIIRSNRIQQFYSTVVNAANGTGIEVYLSGKLIIEHNEVSNAGSGILVKAPAHDCSFAFVDYVTIRYNFVHDVGIGIITHRAPNKPEAPMLIHQNLVVNTNTGYRIWPFVDACGSGPKQAKFVNNTIFACKNECLHVRAGVLGGNDGHAIQNNIVSDPDSTLAVLVESDSNMAPGRVFFDRNLYRRRGPFADVGGMTLAFRAWKKTYEPQDANSLEGDPLFVDAANGNFRLRPGSPALRLGRVVFGIGGPADATIPAGAYITGEETIGLLSTGTGGTSKPR